MTQTILFQRVVLLALLGSILMVVASCGRGPTRIGDVDVRTPVEVQTVRLGDIEKLVVATGQLQPQEVAIVNAQIEGRLYYERDSNGERFFEGHEVKRGDVLARLSGVEADLNLNLPTKKETYEIAQTEYDRQVKLHDEGIITDSAFEQTRQTYLNAKNVYERALLDERNTEVIAPMDGIILKLARNEQNVLLAEETLVGSGQLIAEVADISMLEAYIDLIGPQYTKITKGDPVRIRPSATYEDQTFVGTLKRISPLVNEQNRTFQVVVVVPNEDLFLKPGSFVEVEIITEQRLQVPVIPLDSVKKSRNNNDVVFIVEGQRIQERRVRLGLQDNERVEVLEGLEPGERIVIGGVEHLWSGNLVNVVREQ